MQKIHLLFQDLKKKKKDRMIIKSLLTLFDTNERLFSKITKTNLNFNERFEKNN